MSIIVCHAISLDISIKYPLSATCLTKTKSTLPNNWSQNEQFGIHIAPEKQFCSHQAGIVTQY